MAAIIIVTTYVANKDYVRERIIIIDNHIFSVLHFFKWKRKYVLHNLVNLCVTQCVYSVFIQCPDAPAMSYMCRESATENRAKSACNQLRTHPFSECHAAVITSNIPSISNLICVVCVHTGARLLMLHYTMFFVHNRCKITENTT